MKIFDKIKLHSNIAKLSQAKALALLAGLDSLMITIGPTPPDPTQTDPNRPGIVPIGITRMQFVSEASFFEFFSVL